VTEIEKIPVSWYAVTVLGGISYLCLSFLWFSHAALLTPIVESLTLTDTEAGIIVGAVPLTYVVFSLLSGLVIDRIGPGWGIGIALAIIGLAQILRGVSNSFLVILCATILLGIGGTGITFGLPKLVSRLFPPRLLGSMSTVYILGSFAGTALILGTGRTHFSPFFGGWRPLFFWSGVVVMVFSILWVFILKRHAQSYPDRYEQDTESAFTAGSFLNDLRAVVAHPAMRLLIIIGTMYLFLLHGLQGWLPRILEFRGVNNATVGTITTIFVVGQVIGILLLPPISDKLDKHRELVIVCGVCTAAGIVGLMVDRTLIVTILTVSLAGFGIGGVSPMVRALPTELEGIGPDLTATAVGLVFAIGEIGGFAGPFLIGALQDLTQSFLYSFLVLTACGAVMAIAGFRLPETQQ